MMNKSHNETTFRTQKKHISIQFKERFKGKTGVIGKEGQILHSSTPIQKSNYRSAKNKIIFNKEVWGRNLEISPPETDNSSYADYKNNRYANWPKRGSIEFPSTNIPRKNNGSTGRVKHGNYSIDYSNQEKKLLDKSLNNSINLHCPPYSNEADKRSPAIRIKFPFKLPSIHRNKVFSSPKTPYSEKQPNFETEGNKAAVKRVIKEKPNKTSNDSFQKRVLKCRYPWFSDLKNISNGSDDEYYSPKKSK